MRTIRAGTVMLLALLASAITTEAQQHASSSAQLPSANSAKPTVVLVHGAFADASGWHAVISLLQQDGYRVVAVQNSLASLAGDVETTRRLIDAQTGDVVVVGHSYGGAVISAAAAGNANVRALVCVIPNVGHNLPEESPTEFADAVWELAAKN